MDNLPNPDQAERNQRRKLAFIPMWPLAAAVIAILVLVLVVSR